MHVKFLHICSNMFWLKNIVLLCILFVISSAENRKKGDSSRVHRDARISNNLKQGILSMMRLVRRPRPSMMARLHGRRLSAPLYMVKLYKSISQNQSYHDGFCCNGTIADWRAAGADTIMSYFNQVRKRTPKISRHHVTFKFQVQSPSDEKVMATEFRLYKKRMALTKQSWLNMTYVVRLYQIIYPAQVLDLLQTRVIRSWDTGWQAFDITKAGKAWSENPSTNYGLELSVVNWLNQEVNPYRVGFVGFHGPLEKRPFLVSFFHYDGEHYRLFYSSDVPAGNQTSRSSRSLESPDDDGRTTAGTGDGGTTRGGRGQTGGGGQARGGSGTGNMKGESAWVGLGRSQLIRQNQSKFCQRRFLQVTFRKLGWHGWVIAPQGYTAFYCHGECSFPLNANMNVTNHAIVQTLVHLMHPNSVPKPCCAPTKLSPISVLYYDDTDNIVLKKYTDMVVKECGCQ